MDGIIFDLDGTLWESRINVTESWCEILRRDYPQLREPTPEEFGRQMGKLLADVGRSLFPGLSDEENEEVIGKCCDYENRYLAENGGILFDGLEETLEKLSEKYRLFIVSNCQGGYIEAFYESSGLGKYFTGKLCCGDTGKVKADNIKLIIERFGLRSPVYVGDTALDESSAREAGIPFIWAAYGFGRAEKYDAKLGSITELPEKCGNIEKQQT